MRPGARFASSAGSTRTKRRLLGRRPPQVCPEANELLLKSKERLEAVAMNLIYQAVLSRELDHIAGSRERRIGQRHGNSKG